MSMKRGLLQASLGLTAVVLFVLAIQADQPDRPLPGAGDKTKFNKDQLAAREKVLSEKYREFEQSLLILKQRLEKSARKEDRDRAAQLAKVLEASGQISVSTKFNTLVQFLSKQKLSGLTDIREAQTQSERLAKDLKLILDLLRGTNDLASRREEKLRLEQLLKELERVIRDQKMVIGKIEDGRQNPKDVAGQQRNVRNSTRDLENKLGKLNKDDKNGQGGEAKDNKGEAKKGKGKGTKGEGKNAGKNGETKKGDGKNAGKAGEGKKGEAKDNAKGGQKGAKAGQKGEAKAGQKAGGKQAGAKGAKSGSDSKSGAKGSKGAEGKQGGAKGAQKKGDKQGQAKQGGEKNNVRKKEDDQGKAKKGSDQKSKQGGAKSSQGGAKKSSDSKSGKSADSQGGAKSSKSKSGQGSPKSGGQQQQQQQQQGDAKDDNQKKNGDQQADNTQDARKRIRDAQDEMRKAEQNIAKNKKRAALDPAEKARQDLEAAKKKLEDLLRQLREDELERLLTELKAACEKMLAMQIQVYNGTKAVSRAIDSNKDKKPTRANQQDSLGLSDSEKKIVDEASKAMQMLEAEGSAVAFHEIFTQVRDDMKHVQRRLGSVDVGKVTQTIEEDIIATLGEMIKALEKAKQDLQNKKSPPPNAGPPPPPQDQKLLDQIAELKMIRSMQLRVNKRTQMYGRQYEGEQAKETRIQGELRNLADRQERIFEVTNKIAKGDNR